MLKYIYSHIEHKNIYGCHTASKFSIRYNPAENKIGFKSFCEFVFEYIIALPLVKKK